MIGKESKNWHASYSYLKHNLDIVSFDHYSTEKHKLWIQEISRKEIYSSEVPVVFMKNLLYNGDYVE